MNLEDYYGVERVSKEVFDRIKNEFCIIGSSETVKYLCANDKEREHLKSLGIDVLQDCDWFKINCT